MNFLLGCFWAFYILSSVTKNVARHAGNGCSGRDGGDDFTAGEACCTGGVATLGRVCSATVGAPCIVSDGKHGVCLVSGDQRVIVRKTVILPVR